MTINRDVIMDLLPVYQAGDASAATRALVDEYLKGDPALARRVHQAAADDLGSLAAPAAPGDMEVRAIRKTRQILGRERRLLGTALYFSAVGMSFEFSKGNGRLQGLHWLFLDHPALFGAAIAAAAFCWVAYWRVRRRSREAGF